MNTKFRNPQEIPNARNKTKCKFEAERAQSQILNQKSQIGNKYPCANTVKSLS